jgi:hypothetical protein
MDVPLRDTSIDRGPDGTWYMTGKDDKGQWWSTFFGSDATAPWREGPGILPVTFDSVGRMTPGWGLL